MTEYDDFANDKSILKERERQRLHQEMIEESIDIVKNELNLEKYSHRNMKMFRMFNTLGLPTLIESFRSNIPGAAVQVSVVEYGSHYPVARGHNGGRDHYLFGLMDLQRSYPLTYIYKETIREKIIDLFVKGEMDFKEHKRFSRNFFVVTQDKDKLSTLFLGKDLDALCSFKEMEIEINENVCLFRVSRKSISREESKKFSDLAKAMAQVFY